MAEVWERVYNRIFIGGIITLIWFVFPVLSVFLILGFIFSFKLSKGQITYLLLLTAISFGLIAYTAKTISSQETDITRYTRTFYELGGISTFSAFLFTFVREGELNFIFQTVNFLFAKLLPDNPQVLPFFWVSCTYFFCFLACRLYFQQEEDSGKKIALITFVLITSLIFFFRTTEFIKQCVANSLVAYGFALKRTRGKGGVKWLLFASMVHFSAVIFFPVYYLADKKAIIRRWPLLLFVAVFLGLFNFNEILFSVLGLFSNFFSQLRALSENYMELEGWEITKVDYIKFFAYSSMIMCLFWGMKKKLLSENAFVWHLLLYCLLLINFSNAHNFIRFSITYFAFYAFAFSDIVKMNMNKVSKSTFLVIIYLVFAALNFNELRRGTDPDFNDYANSYMGNSISQILTSNVYEFWLFRVRN